MSYQNEAIEPINEINNMDLIKESLSIIYKKLTDKLASY